MNMSIGVALSVDRTKVMVSLLQGDKQLGWIELNSDQCISFMNNLSVACSNLKPEEGQ